MWSVNQLDPVGLALHMALIHTKEGGHVKWRYFTFKGYICPFSARLHVNRWEDKMAKGRVIETSEDASESHARMGLNLTV
jgi:hypothetical protein